MLTYREITLQDRENFLNFFEKGYYDNSEFSFANLYIWRHSYFMQFCIKDDVLYIMGRYKKNLPFLMPPILMDPKASHRIPMEIVLDDFSARGFPFLVKGVTEEMKTKIENDCPGMFHFEEDPDNFDYVYNSSDLINLPGRKYHKKRNHISQFVRKYDFEYESMGEEHIEECKIASIYWFSQRSTGVEDDLEDEKIAVMEALQNMKALNLKGGLIRVEGRIQAFSLGERLNRDTAVIHIEKANPDIPGLYAMINQKFAEDAWSDMTYINREEDMGLPGLRKSKRSYYPVRMVKKYNVTLKE